MTNTLELDIALKRAGVTRLEVAKQLGISVTAFFNKLHNKTEFKASEIAILKKVLNISEEERDKIFFDCTVD